MTKPVVEINFKNKKHLVCCKTLDVAINEVENVQVELQVFKNELELKYDLPQDMKNRFDDKINDLNTKKQKMKDRIIHCGCD
jgi:mRNA-degrading endonuclease HigB of HigAB toxin-antitoxin module